MKFCLFNYLAVFAKMRNFSNTGGGSHPYKVKKVPGKELFLTEAHIV